MRVVLVPGTICRDISAYRVFQIIHSRLNWVLSFLLLCFFHLVFLSCYEKKMCKNQAMLLYSYVLLDLPLPFFCQRNTKEKRERGTREKGRMKREVCLEFK